jgi:hypothetical protein
VGRPWKRTLSASDSGQRPEGRKAISYQLLSAGYIAGGTVAAVIIALLAFSEEIPKEIAVGSKWLPTMHDLDAWAIAPFALLAVILFGVGSTRPKPE